MALQPCHALPNYHAVIEERKRPSLRLTELLPFIFMCFYIVFISLLSVSLGILFQHWLNINFITSTFPTPLIWRVTYSLQLLKQQAWRLQAAWERQGTARQVLPLLFLQPNLPAYTNTPLCCSRCKQCFISQ